MKRIIVVWLVMLMIGGMLGFLDLSTDAENGNGDAGMRYASTPQPRLYPTHDPIYIDSNDNFTFENGVSNPTAAGTESDPYIIENWDISGSSANGIEIRNTDKCFIIRNCVIHEMGYWTYDGIYFYSVQNGKIENVTSYNNADGGVKMSYSSNNQITNCEIYNNHNGIYLYSSSNNNITSNQVYSNSYDGIWLESSSNNNTIAFNHIHDNHYGIELDSFSNNNTITNCTVYNNDVYGIYLDSYNLYGYYYGCNYNQIINCTVYNNNGYGICLWSSSNNNIIANCNVYNNKYYYSSEYYSGIFLYDSSNNNQITNCTVYNNHHYGIELHSSSNNNTITSCTVYNNPDYGIYLSSSSNNQITNCDVYNNDDGIGLGSSSNNNIITNCDIYNNNDGISLSGSENTITYNVVKSNSGYGISSSGSNNNIHHNNFIDNTNNAYGGSSDSWDDSSEGNYWSDYTLEDAVINAPYSIDGGSGEDNYPLRNKVGSSNIRPTASFTFSPANPTRLDNIYFNGTSTDTGGSIYSRYWAIWYTTVTGAPSITSTAQNPGWKFNYLGNYYVRLVVMDNDGGISEIYQQTVTVVNIPPTADAGTDITAYVGNSISMNGQGSDPDGSIVLYEWDFDGDGSYDWTSYTTGYTLQAYNDAGTYHATLRITDNDGATATDTVTVTVTEKGGGAEDGDEQKEEKGFIPGFEVTALLGGVLVCVLLMRKKRI